MKVSLISKINAIKFTPEGGRIKLGSRLEGANGSEELVVWVKDTGIGIEKKDLQRIFLPFEQVESTFCRKHQGTGLDSR